KTLSTLEGTAKLRSPRFSLMEVMQPFQRGMLLRRLSPVRQAKKLRRLYMEVEQLVEILPQRVIQILEQVQDGKFDVHLDHRGLGPSVNRLVLGMLASALFVGSSFLLSYQVPPLLFHKHEVWLGLVAILILYALIPAATAAGIVYHRGYWQAFCIGVASWLAATVVGRVVAYPVSMLSSTMLLEGTFGLPFGEGLIPSDENEVF